MNTGLSTSPPKRMAYPLGQTGFSLIELMISIAIGLVIVGALVGVLATNSSGSHSNDLTSELVTNGRYAMSTLKSTLRQAGYRGYTWAEPNVASALVITNECLETGATTGTFVSNIRQGIWGANNTNPFSTNCIPAANYATGNDVLVVRRVADSPSATLATNTVYFQSSYEIGQIFQGVTPPTFGSVTPLGSFALNVSVYYISPFTVSASESPLTPALYRVYLDSTGTMVQELVASGIEHMQVQYGVLTSAPNSQYFDTIAGSSSAPTATNWDTVNSVRIWLLARNSVTEPGYTNTSTYVMGDQSYTVNDGYRRQLFTTVVQLRNFPQ